MNSDAPSTILVVEDDDATRTFLADNLTADGYELLVADCARDAVRLLETKFPDLALIDLGLPDASGYEVVRRVREADGVASRVDPSTPLLAAYAAWKKVYEELADGFGANVKTKPDWSPVEKDMLSVIDLEKLLAIERATVENGKH